MASKLFSKRLQQLRMKKGVKQEIMSLDLGLTKSYIYNIEAGYAYPSMTQFFAICEYLDIMPHEFMRFDSSYTTKEEELIEAVAGFTPEEMEQMIAFAKAVRE